MDITLGAITLDGGSTTVRERYEEVGGRDARKVTLTGVVTGMPTLDDVIARLDTIMAAASGSEETPLSLRAGRRLLVRRVKCSREVSAQPIAGGYALELEATDPFEEAVQETVVEWPVTASGDTLEVASAGNADAPATITVAAGDALVLPSVGDATRRITYAGAVNVGDTLVFDGIQRRVTLNGLDVTAYTSGVFPRIAPDGITLQYEDDAASSHNAAIRIAFRDRWW